MVTPAPNTVPHLLICVLCESMLLRRSLCSERVRYIAGSTVRIHEKVEQAERRNKVPNRKRQPMKELAKSSRQLQDHAYHCHRFCCQCRAFPEGKSRSTYLSGARFSSEPNIFTRTAGAPLKACRIKRSPRSLALRSCIGNRLSWVRQNGTVF